MSLEKRDGAVSEGEGEVKAGLNGTNGFAMPLFGLPKIALPSVFGELSEQGVARAQEACEKIKAASDEMAQALRETYSINARSATDYGLKVIEISNANTASAIDFFAHLLGSKSVTDAVSLSATQARKAFDTASAQNKDLWALAQKHAAETGEPVRKQFAAMVLHQSN
jgi:phasin